MLSPTTEQRVNARVGRMVNGKYRLDHLLGAGGMGAVYAATHRNGARAALKFLHPEASQNVEMRTRFQREAYVANQIAHAGIVRVLDDDVDEEGSAYLVMDLLVGQTLESRRAEAGGRLPLDEVIPAALRILDTLAAAHAQAIVHRDVKPENVFLTQDGGLKVMDFGIARALDGSGGTRSGTLMGTPGFMPPEQAGARPKEIDARSDVWATGALMFTLLTGEEVHGARTTQLQLIAAATRPARSVKTLLPLPDDVALLVDTALAFRREDRWQTAEAMRVALSQVAPAPQVFSPPSAAAGGTPPPLGTAATLVGSSLQSSTVVMDSRPRLPTADTDTPGRRSE